MNGKIFTLRNLYQSGTEKLEKAGIREAKLDAWYLLEYKTGISRAVFLADPDREVEEEKAESYQKDICTRARRIPLQHITGEQEFMGLNFKVNENVLVPRQDTEILVEEALKRIRPDMQILDMCTGSGCILESILKFGEKKQMHLKGTGCDISEEALKVARENNSRLGTDARFIKSDLFESVTGKYDMIVSNPPYIRTEEISRLDEEVKLHDPWIALDGKEDGLYFYRLIVKDSSLVKDEVLKQQTGAAGVFKKNEIGYDQGKDVSELLKNEGYEEIEIKKDLAGLDRVVMGRYNKE